MVVLWKRVRLCGLIHIVLCSKTDGTTQGITGREAFKAALNSSVASLPAHHLYACETGAYELFKHLAYRDYLVARSDRAEWLATQKLVVNASAESKDEYIEKKSIFYTVITKESMEWANRASGHGRVAEL